MIDRYGRKIEYMRVSVTDRCNLRCIYCMPEEGIEYVPHSEILTYDEIARICRIASEIGITKIKLTGGEPLVRRGLAELVKMLKSNSKTEQVTLTTNGTLLKDSISELVENGLDAVNISLDTLNESRYREITRGGSLAQVLEGIEASLAFENLPVKINCVPLKDADEEEYLKIAGIAKKSRVDVRFIEMMPIGLGSCYAGRSGNDTLKMLSGVFGEPRTDRLPAGNGPAQYVRFPGFEGRIGFISAITHRFCGQCNRIRLTSEGCLKTCLQYSAGADLRKELRAGSDDSRICALMKKMIYEKPAGHQFGKMLEHENDKKCENAEKISSEKENGSDSFEKKVMSSIGG